MAYNHIIWLASKSNSPLLASDQSTVDLCIPASTCAHQSHHVRTSTPFPVGVHDQSNFALTTQRVTQHCNYCNLCTPIELITNFKSDQLLILIVRTAVQVIARISIQVHTYNSSHLFPPNLSLHLLQCNSNTFNSYAYICFEETTIISIQLHQFRSSCVRFNHSTILNQQSVF